MQTLSHAMTHRGASASRANSRWHPYTPPRSTSAASTPNYANVPPSIVVQLSETFLHTPSSICTISPASAGMPSRNCSPAVTLPHPSSGVRVASQIIVSKSLPSKATYITALVDQAVKALTDIWHPECIPPVFATSTRSTGANRSVPPPLPQSLPSSCRPSLQLPSPCSPSTHPTPPVTPLPRTSSCGLTGETDFTCNSSASSEKDLVPMKTFVHEVLRRSRTTCSVLQSALCYIEAIRKRVPQLVQEEQQGEKTNVEAELVERIDEVIAENSAVQFLNSLDTYCSGGSITAAQMHISYPPTNNIPLALAYPTGTSLPRLPEMDGKSQDDTSALPPLPPLPSPLLCPRRTFLAALILASKFLQDRCYSNRAWAKLSGLPPREVGRCERALGEALEWRLWVGKGTAPVTPGNRSIPRSRSECRIPVTPGGSRMQYLSPPLSDAGSSPDAGRWMSQSQQSTTALRRATTLPDEAAFKFSHSQASITCPPIPCVPDVNVHPRSFITNCIVPSSLSSSSSRSRSPESSYEVTPKMSSPPSLGESDIDTPTTTNWSSPRNCVFAGYSGMAPQVEMGGKFTDVCNTVKITESTMVMDSAPWFTETTSYGLHFGQRSMLDSMAREVYGQA